MTPVDEIPRPTEKAHNLPHSSPKFLPTSSKMSTLRDRRRSAPGTLPDSPLSDRAGRSDADPNSPARSQQNFIDSANRNMPLLEPAQRLLTPPLTEDEDLLYRFRDRAGSLSEHDSHGITSLDRQVESFFSPTSSNASVSDVIRSIPKPRFPIRVSRGEPKPFSLEAQRKVMRWTHERGHFLPDPDWLEPPLTDNIKDIVWPYLEDLGVDYQSIKIEFLTEGGFNRIFTIDTTDVATQKEIHYVFRVALPVDPYYKTESDVATTELVRHFTGIPVPTIYAYDSSAMNAIGLEWMLMEKVKGTKLDDVWTDMDYATKIRLTQTVAAWTTQLAKISSSKIGSIYMRETARNLDFYVGRSVAAELSQESRLNYQAFRGPFASLDRFYNSFLGVVSQEINDLSRAFHSNAFHFEPTSLKFRGTFLEQHPLYYLDGHRDWTDEEWKIEQTKELEMLSAGVKALQEALPTICAKAPETSRKLTTFLAHDDLSRRNIFVNESGSPVALLDWEAIEMQPLLFLTNAPDFIQSCEEEHEPEIDFAAYEEQWKRHGFSEEEKDRFRYGNAKWFKTHMENYVCTKLRTAYKEELQRLSCPLSHVDWEDYNSLDRELIDRVMHFSRDVDEVVEWTEDMLALGEGSESEDSEEDEDDR